MTTLERAADAPSEPAPKRAFSLGRASGIIAIGTLLSRVLGFLRDAVCAAVFGMGDAMGAFNLAWIVPNLFRRFFGEGALAAAFIPRAARAHEHAGRAGLRDLLSVVHGTLLLVLGLIAILGMILCSVIPPQWLSRLLDEEQASLFLGLTTTLFPYVLLVCSLALWMGALNSVHHFLAPAMAPAILNTVWILGALAVAWWAPASWNELDRVASLAWIILLGGVCQVLVQVVVLRREGLLALPVPRPRDPEVRRIGRDMLPVVGGLAVVQFNLILDQVMAIGFVSTNANNYTYFANRLMQFPLGVIGIAVATAVFPSLARHGERGDRKALEREGQSAFQFVAFLAIPAACGLFFLAEPVVRVLFDRGKVIEADVIETAATLRGYAIGIPAFCIVHLLTRTYYALGEHRRPMRIVARLVFVNLALNFAFVFPLGVQGLALSTSVTALANATWLAWELREQHGVHSVPPGRDGPWSMLGAGAAACFTAACIEPWLRVLGSAVALFTAIAIGVVLYVAASWFVARGPLLRLVNVLRRRRA